MATKLKARFWRSPRYARVGQHFRPSCWAGCFPPVSAVGLGLPWPYAAVSRYAALKSGHSTTSGGSGQHRAPARPPVAPNAKAKNSSHASDINFYIYQPSSMEVLLSINYRSRVPLVDRVWSLPTGWQVRIMINGRLLRWHSQ